MAIDEMSHCGVIVGVVGMMSAAALLVSKISLLLKGEKGTAIRYYECGFRNLDPNFVYASENYRLFALFVTIESAVVWVLSCCSLGITDKQGDGNIFIRVLLCVLITLIMAAYRTCYPKRKLWLDSGRNPGLNPRNH
jgi:NADH:ubiquinone oxidoreductase subunit 3 (subunit A)